MDDRPENNVLERQAFEAIGLSFALAVSTDEALERVRSENIAVIISDMARKEGPREGYALLGALRAKDDQTPFFTCAGSDSPAHRREAAKRGAQGSANDPQELFQLVS